MPKTTLTIGLLAVAGLATVAGFTPCLTIVPAKTSARLVCQQHGTSRSILRRATPELSASARNDADMAVPSTTQTSLIDRVIFAFNAFLVKWGMLVALFVLTPALAFSNANASRDSVKPSVEVKAQNLKHNNNHIMTAVSVASGIGLVAHTAMAHRNVKKTSRRK